MNLDDFKDNIEFKNYKVGETAFYTAQISFRSCFAFSEIAAAAAVPPSPEFIKDELTKRLLCFVYDYDQQHLIRAILELRRADPFDPRAQDKAIEKVLLAARRQPPRQ